MSNSVADNPVELLHSTIVALVRRDQTDLTARQLAVFLTCYLEDEAQTVRGLAQKLHVSKPAITRALNRLEATDLARRKPDLLDRRSVLVARTASGNRFLRELMSIMRNARKSIAVTKPA